jgi:hypothetical protein
MEAYQAVFKIPYIPLLCFPALRLSVPRRGAPAESEVPSDSTRLLEVNGSEPEGTRKLSLTQLRNGALTNKK